jgi:head-tail adaptor
MRLGRLDKRVQILSLSSVLGQIDHGQRWASIRAKEAGDVAQLAGLRATGLVEVRARYSDELQQGRYLRTGSRLLYISSAPRDPMATKAEMVVTCAELVGQVAEYQPQVGAPVACRVHLSHQAPYLDDLGQVTDYKTKAEVAVIEVGRPEEGDQLLIAGTLYTVIAYARDSDDGVVRGLWLEVA